VPERLRSASILVLPSRDESLPAAVLEAMACGLSVIASDVGGTSEVVRDGATGVLASDGDFTSVAKACHAVAASGELRQRLGRAARALMTSRHDKQTTMRRTEQLIRSIMGTEAKR
jgi:glycosyltransferase involved in cell wall biosynthesis